MKKIWRASPVVSGTRMVTTTEDNICVWRVARLGVVWNYVQEEPGVSCRWSGWVRETITGWVWDFRKFTDRLRGISKRIYLEGMKKIWRASPVVSATLTLTTTDDNICVWRVARPGVVWNYVQEEPGVSCRWTGWVRETITGWVRDFRKFTDRLRGIRRRIYLEGMKKFWRVSACDRLELESLRSWRTMPKTSQALVWNVARHRCHVGVRPAPRSINGRVAPDRAGKWQCKIHGVFLSYLAITEWPRLWLACV